jgi:hypothetical protein
MNTSISRREWRTVTTFAAIVISLTLLPYLAGWLSQTPDMRFSGALIGADDFNSYIGKMRLGARGIFDFYLFYTPEPHDPVPLVFLAYILPGYVVGRVISPDDPALTPALAVTFHLMRVVFNALLIVTLYRFIALFLRPPAQRLTALMLATLGGGFGWLVLLLGGGGWLGSLPADFYIPEGFTSLVLLSLPHIALARAALLGGFMALFHALSLERGWLRPSLVAAACWLLVGLIVPFYLAVIYAVLGAWGAALWLRGRRFPLAFALRGGIAAGITLPLFAYYSLAFAQNPTFAAWSAQNLLPSPNPLHYLIAYAIFIALGAFAVRWAWRRARRRGDYALLLAWVVVVPILVYLPINVQRRTAEAVIVPLAILAAHGLALLLRRLRQRPRTLRTRGFSPLTTPLRRILTSPTFLRNTVLALASLTSIFLLLTTLLGALNVAPPVYVPQAGLDAFAWLQKDAPADAVVLSSFETGNLLPAYTDLRPYVGHGPETVGSLDKQADVARFFRDEMSADERAALFASVNIRYLIYGANESALRADMSNRPQFADGLTLVYEGEGWLVYRVGE